jgi:hypothetical protein
VPAARRAELKTHQPMNQPAPWHRGRSQAFLLPHGANGLCLGLEPLLAQPRHVAGVTSTTRWFQECPACPCSVTRAQVQGSVSPRVIPKTPASRIRLMRESKSRLERRPIDISYGKDSEKRSGRLRSTGREPLKAPERRLSSQTGPPLATLLQEPNKIKEFTCH